MADESTPIKDALDMTKEIAGKSVPVGTKVGESAPVDDPESHPIKDAMATTKEIAGKSVPVATPTDEPLPETHPLKDAMETTKDIAAKSVPVGKPTDEKPEGGLLKDIGDKIVNMAEKVTHSDINNDGKIGGKDA